MFWPENQSDKSFDQKSNFLFFLVFIVSESFLEWIKSRVSKFHIQKSNFHGCRDFFGKKIVIFEFFWGVWWILWFLKKNVVLIDNFKSGKIQKNLHFQKHGHLGNWFCQVPMFLDFWFLHFPCKFKIINGRGSDVIFWENKVKTG